MARKPSSSSKAPAPRPRAPIGARTDRAKPKPEAKHDRAATVAKTPKGKPVPKGRAGTIALVGRPNVGKSTLFNAMIGERIAIISHHPQTTRDRIAGILTTQGTQLVFQDTPGIHQPKTKLGRRMNEVASGTAEEADVVVFVVDVPADPVAEAQRAEATREKDAAVLRGVPKDKPVVLVVNKIDRIKEKSKLLDVLTAYSALHDFAAVVPVTAKKRDGIERLRAVLGELLPEGELLYPEDDISDRPVRFFIAELVREQVLMRTREEVPHGIAVTVDAFEEPPTKASVPATAASRSAFGRTSGRTDVDVRPSGQPRERTDRCGAHPSDVAGVGEGPSRLRRRSAAQPGRRGRRRPRPLQVRHAYDQDRFGRRGAEHGASVRRHAHDRLKRETRASGDARVLTDGHATFSASLL
jgi:GTP-binding protein Era